MGKKKKNMSADRTPRPRCGQIWVSEYGMICVICGAVGEALNAGAEKLLKRLGEGKSINTVPDAV